VNRAVLRLSLPLREPFVTSGGVVSARELALLRIEDDDGFVGCGEAAPLENYDGVSLDAVIDELRHEGAAALPQARAAEELARLDLQARREGRALGEPGADAIVVNRTLGGGPPGEMAGRAREAVREGYSCVKVKVGLPDDLERVAAVREAIGPWPALRVDANGAWSVDEAREAIAGLAPYDLQLVEQPCRTLEELAMLRAEVEVPLAADESISGPDDVRVAAELRACDAVNVKLASAGGFGAAREAVRAARYSGLEPYLSSTLDGPWGIAAALQLAASERLSLACGLATLQLFDTRLARTLPGPRMGLMNVPEGPGLGVEPDPGALEAVVTERVVG
jgi:L-alanine-DL-glutamate epimerase-like enolase superfamily enzyme